MRVVIAVAVAVIALAGCPRPTPAPQSHAIRLVIVNDEPLPIYVQAAQAWRELGIDVGFEDRGMPECPFKWPTATRCQITIGIVRVVGLRKLEGSAASTNRAQRRVQIDTEVTDRYRMLITIAHEIGHVVLDTPRHTTGGVMGGADWVLHDVDRDLACETIGICLHRASR